MTIARDGYDCCIDSISKGELMTAKKCPICDWVIKDGGIKVKVGEKEITVCCDDCAKKAGESPSK